MSPQILEASMLILFGCSWPGNIAKSVRAGTARGKSILYELIVCAGYVCGIAGKFLSAQTGWVVYIYILDLMMVLTDVALTLRNRYLDRLADERMRREHA